MTEVNQETGKLVESSGIAPYSPDADLTTEWQQADTIVGHDLLSKTADIFSELEGLPFMITRAVFRYGDIQPKGLSYHPDYVSLEAIIPPAEVLEQRLKFKGIERTPFTPGQMIVFNDGSTGIRRQVVSYLIAKGMLPRAEGPLEGGIGESILDTPLATEDNPAVTFDMRLTCPRGLRKSEYSNEYTGEGKTYYLG